VSASALGRGAALTALPPLALLLVFFAYPVARFLLLSIEGGTFAHLEKAVADQLYLRVLTDTLLIALYVAVLCLVLAYPLAWFLATVSPLWTALGFALLLLPFWTSVLVRTYAWMVILGRNGVINRALLQMGVIADPLPLLFNTTGVLIGMTHVLLPYMVFPIYTSMMKVEPALMLAAEGLGASGWQVFRRVFLPLTMPGVLAGMSLVFMLSVGFYITPALLGGGRVVMIANLIEKQVRALLDWNLAAALALVLLLAVLLVNQVFNRLLRSAA
jgi:putative spermidine/putrescine transport system permease protein